MQSLLVPNFSNHGIESYGFRVLCGTSGEVESLLSEEIFFFCRPCLDQSLGFASFVWRVLVPTLSEDKQFVNCCLITSLGT